MGFVPYPTYRRPEFFVHGRHGKTRKGKPNAIKSSVTGRHKRGKTTNHANPRGLIRADSRDS
ncbi:MAG: hypothetical protein [Olavius algarvensis Gamma 1 endosymbiont]|nr:MAG: hypothetical protein [Olavius algarvensis Gamma 1 endosymbiont]